MPDTQNNHTERLSSATENYLLSIYRLKEREDVSVTPTILSEHLKTLPQAEGVGTSLPSIAGMVRRMTRERLIEQTHNKELILTESGHALAENIVRRHRLAERLVVDILELDLAKAHIEAHQLEHAISPRLEKKISEKLGNPTTCPFGHPIPRSGYVPIKNTLTLDCAVAGQNLEVVQVPEDDQDLLTYFVQKGFVPGNKVLVQDVSPARGVIMLKSGEQSIVFSHSVASKVVARKLA
ncbi:MAG: metal-dependent transcriptional regulator [Chloroflexota bacterium]|nr:metal-dependent transcriptional regulator [Chloroflexota bacterium]